MRPAPDQDLHSLERRALRTIGAALHLADTPDLFVTHLPFDPVTGLVIRGVYQGLDVGRACELEHGSLSETYALVAFRTVSLRPWWRLWRPTPALRLSASHAHPGAV